MVALEFLTVSLLLRHELCAGVPIIANPRLLACTKPRDAGFEAGRHTAAHHLPRGVRGVGVSPEPGHSFTRWLAAGSNKS